MDLKNVLIAQRAIGMVFYFFRILNHLADFLFCVVHEGIAPFGECPVVETMPSYYVMLAIRVEDSHD